jgi:hypothetical protein
MGWTCNWDGETTNSYRILVGNFLEGGNFEDQEENGRITSSWRTLVIKVLKFRVLLS